jgi:long-chain acyl-CoA synthetase
MQSLTSAHGYAKTSLFSGVFGRSGWGTRPAILGRGACNHGELMVQCEELARVLHRAGVGPKTIVALCLPMSREYIIALLAVRLAGGTAVLLSPRATALEKSYVLENSKAAYVLASSRAELPMAATREWQGCAVVGPLHKDEVELESDDCLIIYTSGSTSTPKGVVLTERGVSDNVLAVADYLCLSAADRGVVFTPPQYAYAVSQVLTHIWAGAAIWPYEHGLLRPSELLVGIGEFEVTGLSANPTTFRILDAVGSSSWPRLRYIMTGGQPLDSQLARKISAQYPTARLVNMYGCTENSPRVSYQWLPLQPDRRDCPWPVGQPIRGTKIRVVSENGDTVPADTVGEVLVTGLSLMRCYWREPELTRRHFRDGWFCTGDLGFMDKESNLHLVGRVDNIINVGHEKVVPEEIETAMRRLAGVLDVAVTSIPDDIVGNVPVALVVMERSEKDDVARLRHRCAEEFSGARRLRTIVLVDALPRTNYGKLNRAALREVARTELLTV